MGQHIVDVEDEPLNAILFVRILRKGGGFDVTVSEDVDEILRLANAGLVHLFVMDVSLSNSSYEGVAVDGVAITRLLKGNERTKHIPVILATAHAMRGDAERLLREVTVPDSELDGPRLAREVGRLLGSVQMLVEMARAARQAARPDAAERIAEETLDLARGG